MKLTTFGQPPRMGQAGPRARSGYAVANGQPMTQAPRRQIAVRRRVTASTTRQTAVITPGAIPTMQGRGAPIGGRQQIMSSSASPVGLVTQGLALPRTNAAITRQGGDRMTPALPIDHATNARMAPARVGAFLPVGLPQQQAPRGEVGESLVAGGKVIGGRMSPVTMGDTAPDGGLVSLDETRVPLVGQAKATVLDGRAGPVAGEQGGGGIGALGWAAIAAGGALALALLGG